MRKNNSIVVILGNDHTNSLGVAQSVGKCDYFVVAAVWGRKTGFLAASKYVKEIITGVDPQACISNIIKRFSHDKGPIPIIACCDSAAVALEDNRARLTSKFIFEYTTKQYSLRQLTTKKLQVELAEQCGFNVPQSIKIGSIVELPDKLDFEPPYIIKALVSMEGSKNDLVVCRSYEDLREQAKTVLQRTPRILVQQYIERDYEISILGCGTCNSGCIAPAIEYKLTLYPKNVGLECLAYVDKLEEESEMKQCINRLIAKIGYVGLFSIEMMHCKKDGKYYFTEINLRNDGANSFIFKYGINLPEAHIRDLFGIEQNLNHESHPGYYIWEMHHFLSLIHREISLSQWLREIWKAKGFLTYCTEDTKPFYVQFFNLIKAKLRIQKTTQYE